MRWIPQIAAASLCGLFLSPLAARSTSVAPASGSAPASAQVQLDSGSGQPNSKQWVSFLGPETTTVAAAKPSTVTLHFQVADGFHVNSHTPLTKNLIATQLIVIEGQGIKVANVDFPGGQPYAFSFDPTNKLDVYSGDFAITAHVTVARGTHPLHAALRYQACDHAACYPPKMLPVVVTLTAN
jgi:hypothetical protein